MKSLFHDVESINDHLKKQERTVELFKKLSEANPEFAGEIYNLAGEALIGAKEYSLAKKFLGDPMAQFSTAKNNFHNGMEYAKTSPMSEMSRSAFEAIFVEDAVRLITLLDKTGDRELALKIQKEALSVLSNPEIKNAIPPKTL